MSWLLPLVFGQLLYSLGTSVSTGTVFRYTVDDWQLPAFTFTLLLVLPETAQTFAVGCGSFVQRATSAKRLWLTTAIATRAVATVAAFGPAIDPAKTNHAWAWSMIALLGIAEAIQAVSYVALVVWLSRLTQADQFGGVFGPRRAGVVAGMIAVPYLLKALDSDSGPGRDIGGTFDLLVGNAVAAIGIGVFLLIPADSRPGDPSRRWSKPLLTRLRHAIRRPGVPPLILSCWHLAAAQGLTQYVFFRYSVDVLEVDAGEKTELVAAMFLAQLPQAWVAGWACDRFGDRKVFAAGVWTTAAALPCWLVATPDGKWLWAAYLLWGAFSFVNVAIQTMSLRRSDETTRPEVVSLVRFGGGLLAALTPLAVSPLLPDRVAAGASEDPLSIWVVLIVISFLGRTTAPAWLWRRSSKIVPVNSTDE